MYGSRFSSLRQWYRLRGIRQRGGARKPLVFTTMSQTTGTRARVTVTPEAFSSSIRRGNRRAEWAARARRRRVSRFIVLGWSITVTATRGANGEPRERADSAE